MSDEKIRQLERQASQGDETAQEQLQRKLCRMGEHAYTHVWVAIYRKWIASHYVECMACKHSVLVPWVPTQTEVSRRMLNEFHAEISRAQGISNGIAFGSANTSIY